MIGLIGRQEDAIGFALAGIKHVQEVSPQASKQEVQQALKQLENKIDVLIMPASLHRHVEEETKNVMVIPIPEDENNKAQEIDEITKELLGIEL